jgi:NAD(P)-dependent dehydrogenase (short-subunit alcohol dehydrogenase family)/acyl carrier protein
MAPALDSVQEKVLALVAAKTGYPQDMLDLDLDLEADLGIDTVKQAETFASIREAFAIPVQEGLSLRDYPTLQHVIDFVYKMRPELQPPPGTQDGSTQWVPEVVEGPTIELERAPVAELEAAPNDPVRQQVLAIVAAKTGYPQDMLDLDLDLEADLGIDTVKQAETFAKIREAFDIPFQEGLSLRDYPTLNHVIAFVYQMRPQLQPAAAPIPSSPYHPVIPLSPSLQPSGSLDAANSMPRRVPIPTLRPGLDLCKPTGVVLDEGSRVVVMPDRDGVGQSLIDRLQKRGVIVLRCENGVATDLAEQMQGWLAEGPIHGVFWLPALDVEPALEEMDLAEWRALNRMRVKNLYTTMRALYAAISARGTFLVAATRLGGLHGYGAEGATAPLGGGVAGFCKSYKRERPDVTVKVVDFEVSRKTAEPADLLIAEALADPGVVEVGYRDGLRTTVSFEERPAADGRPGMALGADTVFVVTGAAGGITSAIVADLAVASKGIFYLLDLVALPAADDEYVHLLRTDKEALKQALIDQARAAGERPTPVQIERQIMAVERAETALRAVEAVEAAGGTVHYYSVDLLDGNAVQAVVDDVRRRHGRIDVLLHAGGVILDAPLDHKEPEQFDRVFDVKADGFFNLLLSARGLPIGATVVFSSVAGRFGNQGQSDYAAANDLLCKITSSLRAWRPETRGIAIDWTAWGGIGMAARGTVPQIMERLGVDMLSPAAGVPTIRRDLIGGGTRGEVIVAGRLGAMVQEFDESGGLDVEKAQAWLAAHRLRLPMLGQVKRADLYGGLAVETTLDPSQQPFLYDHQVEEGVSWLPAVMGVEALAELAVLLAPGYRVKAVSDLQILGAFKFHHGQPRTLHLGAEILPGDGGQLVAKTVLRSVFQPAKPELPPQVKEHFVACVHLTREAPPSPRVEFRAADNLPVDAAQLYRIFFHGPAYQVVERAGVDGDTATALFAQGLPANTMPEAGSLLGPRLLELCFQTAALWSIETRGEMALPASFDAVESYCSDETPAGRRLYAVVTARADGKFDARVVDDQGAVSLELRGYGTVAKLA